MKVQKLVYILIALCFFLVIASRFFEYQVTKDFLIYTTISCEPSSHNCFVWDCSPEDDIECDTSPYAKIQIPMRNTSKCLLEHSCAENEFVCREENECTLTYCLDDELVEGEVCTGSNV